MTRVLTSLLASLCAAPLFYFLVSWLVIALNQDAQGPDDRLDVAYLSTFGGCAAALAGAVLVWFLTQRFLVTHHLWTVQLFNTVALIGWLIAYMNYVDEQPKRLEYGDQRPVLDVEVKATKTLPQRPTESTDWSGWIKPVQDRDYPLPEPALDNLRLRYRFRLLPYGQQL